MPGVAYTLTDRALHALLGCEDRDAIRFSRELVPKLSLATQFFAKFHFGGAKSRDEAQLREHRRSQVQLGNENASSIFAPC